MVAILDWLHFRCLSLCIVYSNSLFLLFMHVRLIYVMLTLLLSCVDDGNVGVYGRRYSKWTQTINDCIKIHLATVVCILCCRWLLVVRWCTWHDALLPSGLDRFDWIPSPSSPYILYTFSRMVFSNVSILVHSHSKVIAIWRTATLVGKHTNSWLHMLIHHNVNNKNKNKNNSKYLIFNQLINYYLYT